MLMTNAALHCACSVYDQEAKAFMQDLTYIPGRHGGGTHCNYWDANDNCLSWDTEKEYTWESATTYWQNVSPWGEDGLFSA